MGGRGGGRGRRMGSGFSWGRCFTEYTKQGDCPLLTGLHFPAQPWPFSSRTSTGTGQAPDRQPQNQDDGESDVELVFPEEIPDGVGDFHVERR